jgi:hypothetical protein
VLLQNLERLQIQRQADSRWTLPLTSNERCRKSPAGMGFGGLRELLKFTKVPRSDVFLFLLSDLWVVFYTQFEVFAWVFSVRKTNFCTRQFTISATSSSFSEGQAISWIQPNCLGCLPALPSTPRIFPSSVIL